MEGQDNSEANGNWLKEYTLERAVKTCEQVFHRMRAVRLMLLRPEIMAGKSGLTKTEKVKFLVQEQSDIVRKNIEEMGDNVSKDPRYGEWSVPYDSSEEVINDAIKWHEKLIAQTAGNVGFAKVGVSLLIGDLYRGTWDRKWVEENMADTTKGDKASDFIRGMVTNKEVRINNPDSKAVEAGIQDANNKLGVWIDSLRFSINSLYKKTAQPKI